MCDPSLTERINEDYKAREKALQTTLGCWDRTEFISLPSLPPSLSHTHAYNPKGSLLFSSSAPKPHL